MANRSRKILTQAGPMSWEGTSYDLGAREGIDVVDFYEEEFLFACSPGLFPMNSAVDLSVAITSDLVFYGNSSVGQSSVSFRAARDAAAESGLPFFGGREVQSIEIWRGLIARGLGTAIAPYATIKEEVRHGEISAHRISGAPIVRRLGIAALSDVLARGREIGFVDYILDLLDDAGSPFRVGTPAST